LFGPVEGSIIASCQNLIVSPATFFLAVFGIIIGTRLACNQKYKHENQADCCQGSYCKRVRGERGEKENQGKHCCTARKTCQGTPSTRIHLRAFGRIKNPDKGFDEDPQRKQQDV
jgi:hypothetical protein